MSVGVKGVYVVPDVVLDELERSVEEECKIKQDEQQIQDEQLNTCQFESDISKLTDREILLNCYCHNEQRRNIMKLVFFLWILKIQIEERELGE